VFQYANITPFASVMPPSKTRLKTINEGLGINKGQRLSENRPVQHLREVFVLTNLSVG